MNAQDLLYPKWGEAGKCHDWRNHVPEEVKAIWSTFTPAQLLALYAWADGLADSEVWE